MSTFRAKNMAEEVGCFSFDLISDGYSINLSENEAAKSNIDSPKVLDRKITLICADEALLLSLKLRGRCRGYQV